MISIKIKYLILIWIHIRKFYKIIGIVIIKNERLNVANYLPIYYLVKHILQKNYFVTTHTIHTKLLNKTNSRWVAFMDAWTIGQSSHIMKMTFHDWWEKKIYHSIITSSWNNLTCIVTGQTVSVITSGSSWGSQYVRHN